MGRTVVLCAAGPCILGVKLEHPGGTVCATCHPAMSLCQAPARVGLWQLCLVSPSVAHPRDSVRGSGRAGGDITSNGPECGNSVNKVYFTFNFDI